MEVEEAEGGGGGEREGGGKGVEETAGWEVWEVEEVCKVEGGSCTHRRKAFE